MDNKIGFLGFGEIGQAIHKLYQNSGLFFSYFIKDLNRHDELKDLDVLNVAIGLISKTIYRLKICFRNRKQVFSSQCFLFLSK